MQVHHAPEAAGEPWPTRSFMAYLKPRDQQQFLAMGREREFFVGQAVLHEGGTDTDVLLVASGLIKEVTTSPDMRVTLLSIRGRGDLVGHLSALDQGPRHATAIAATRVVAQALTGKAFRTLLESNPQPARAVRDYLVSEIRTGARRLTERNNSTSVGRVASVLAELAVNFGQRQDHGGVLIEVGMSQSELGALAGGSMRSVEQALSALRQRGLIKTGYRQISVPDVSALISFTATASGTI